MHVFSRNNASSRKICVIPTRANNVFFLYDFHVSYGAIDLW
jgi:hypothetical protein